MVDAPPVVTTTYKTIRVKYIKYGAWYWYVGFAVSLGYRAVPTNDKNCRVVRIWMNGGLIYDVTNNYLNTQAPAFRLGTEDQDSYRGQMILTFPFINLGSTDDSVSVPAVTAEIWDGVDTSQFATDIGYVTPGDATFAEYDRDNRRLLVMTQTATAGAIIKEVVNDQEQRTVFDPTQDATLPMAFAPWSNIALCWQDGLLAFSLETSTALSIYADAWAPFVQPAALLGQKISYAGQLDTAFLIDNGDGTQAVMLLHGDALVFGANSSTSDALAAADLVCITRGQVRDGESDFILATAGALWRLTVGKAGSDSLTLADYAGDDPAPLTPALAVKAVAGEPFTTAGTIRRVYYDAADDTVIVLYSDHAQKLAMADFSVIWTTDTFVGDGTLGLQANSQMSTANIDNGELFVKVAGENAFTLIDLNNGLISADTFNPSDITIADDEPYLWDSQMQMVYPLSGKKFLQINVPSSATLTVDTVVRTLAQRAGYDPADIITAGLDDFPIEGYVVGAATTLEDILDNLSQFYGFTYAEVGGKLIAQASYVAQEFVNIATIPEGDLAVLQEGNAGDQEKINTVIGGDANLPAKITVTYIDQGMGYNLKTQTAQRQKAPNRTQGSDQVVNLTLPIVSADGTEMLSLLYQVLYSVWASRTTHTIRLPRKYLSLFPTDGITFSAYGIQHRVSIVSSTINADFSLSISVAERQTGVIAPDVPIQPYGGPALLGPPKGVRVAFLDLPDVDPSQTAGGLLNLMAGASGYAPAQYHGARIDIATSDDPNGYIAAMQLDAESPMGTVFSYAPGPNADNVFATDNDSVLVVAAGAITNFPNATYDEMLAGANLLAVGRDSRAELLQYGNAANNGDGTWTLTKFMRGRFGTDTVVNMLAVGDTVVFYNTLNRLVYPTDDFTNHLTYYYRAVSHGMVADEVQHFALVPNANSKRPHAPLNYKAQYTGVNDVTIAWVRRERWNAPLLDAPDIPAEIPPAHWSIDIYNPDWSAIKRRVTFTLADATLQWVYPAADQELDDLFTATELNLVIYEIDPEIGRGFGRAEVVHIDPAADIEPIVGTGVMVTGAAELNGEGTVLLDIVGSGAMVTRAAKLDGDGATGPATDPHFADVKLLLHADGTNGQTTTTDSSGLPHTISRVGAIALSTAEVEYGTASIGKITTRGTYFSAPVTDFLIHNATPFTMELSLFFTSIGRISLFSSYDGISVPQCNYVLVLDASMLIFVYYTSSGVSNSIIVPYSAGLFPANQWIKLAVDYDGSDIRVYVDGVMVQKAAPTGTFNTDTTNPFAVGGYPNDPLTNVDAFIDEFRFTNGTARYASDAGYTPATAPFPDS